MSAAFIHKELAAPGKKNAEPTASRAEFPPRPRRVTRQKLS